MTGLELFLGALFLLYFILLAVVKFGWNFPKAFKNNSKTFDNRITVVIPFRNEQSNIADIVEDLKNQKTDRTTFEVIFVNDHSTDDSDLICKKLISGVDGFTIISLPENLRGKKYALANGIESAKGSIIVTSDADCRVSRNWLESIRDLFNHQEVNMLVGGVAIEPSGSLISEAQSLEGAALTAVTAASINLNIPIMCSGANLAFRKEVYKTVGGYEGNFDIPSGDDEFLMRKIEEHFPGTIYYHHNPEVVVRTKALESMSQLFSQRIRWAGKWKFNLFSATSLVAVFLVVFNVGFLPRLRWR
ncbi:MAG: glycosyltransferase [Flammeovirgaceae bacterium]|nr:glycosyltransferase [Flammeovirgaceae bacterium]